MRPLRRYLVLVPLSGDDEIISVPYAINPPHYHVSSGRTFRRTSERTQGGYIVYREVEERAT